MFSPGVHIKTYAKLGFHFSLTVTPVRYGIAHNGGSGLCYSRASGEFDVVIIAEGSRREFTHNPVLCAFPYSPKPCF